MVEVAVACARVAVAEAAGPGGTRRALLSALRSNGLNILRRRRG